MIPFNKNDHPKIFFLFAYWHDKQWKHFVGASVKIWDLANNLHHMGHHVELFLPKYRFQSLNASFKIIEIPIIDLPFLRMISFNICLLFYLLFRGFNACPDVVYLRRTTTVIPMLYAKLVSTLFFFEVNDDPYYDPLDVKIVRLQGHVRNALSVRIDEWNLKSADRAFVISTEIISKILKKNPALEPEKFKLMPSGANVELFLPIRRKQALSAVRMDPANKYVGFIGSLLSHQGIETLIHAADKILKSEPCCRFLIIGEGPMKKEWQAMVKNQGLEGVFIFTGQISYRVLPNWVNVMDVCVAPYSADAGYRSPVKIFDYLACGRPVVASRITGTTNIFENLDAVTLVEPEHSDLLSDAILNLLSNPENIPLAGKKARQWVVTHYSRSAIAATIVDEVLQLRA